MSRGVLAIFNNVSAGRDEDFDAWFQGEHLPERLAIPGFLYGRRHRAISGTHGYFNFYITENPEVLTSGAYVARIDDPTPRTKVVMSEIFRDMCRTVCRREFRLGKIRGGMTVTARFTERVDTSGLIAALREFAKDETVPGGEVWSSVEKPGAIRTEEKLRGGDQKIAACLLIDAIHHSQAEEITARVGATFPGAEVGVFRVLCQLGDGDA